MKTITQPIEFIEKFHDYVAEIELVVTPGFYPVIRKLYETDPHELITPDTLIFGTGEGKVWEIFLSECRKMKLL